MRILLVNPHETDQGGFSNVPLGLLYLAAALRAQGHEVSVVDGYLDGWAGIVSRIDEFAPEMVGITSYTPGRHKALDIARYAKEMPWNPMVVLGGPHPSIMWRQILEHYQFVDACVVGEGEQALVEIAAAGSAAGIPGVACRQDGKVSIGPRRKYVADLDEILFPAWDLVELDRYPGGGNVVMDVRGGPVPLGQVRIPVVFSRGCPGECSFCSTWWIWRGHRSRSGHNMAGELEMLNMRGYKHFVFEDDAMTIDRDRTLDLCREIVERDLHLAFFCTSRVDAMDDELALALKEAGCYGMSFGLESGAPEILDRIGKRQSMDDVRRAVDACRKAGIAVCGLMIVGNVGETDQTINQSVAMLRDLGVEDIGTVGGLWILPGTRVYRLSRQKGLIDDDFWLGQEPFKVWMDGFDRATLNKWHGAICTRSYV